MNENSVIEATNETPATPKDLGPLTAQRVAARLRAAEIDLHDTKVAKADETSVRIVPAQGQGGNVRKALGEDVQVTSVKATENQPAHLVATWA